MAKHKLTLHKKNNKELKNKTYIRKKFQDTKTKDKTRMRNIHNLYLQKNPYFIQM